MDKIRKTPNKCPIPGNNKFVEQISQQLEQFPGHLKHGGDNTTQLIYPCLLIDLDNSAEYAHLNKLSNAPGLPLDLAEQIKSQAKQALDSEKVLN